MMTGVQSETQSSVATRPPIRLLLVDDTMEDLLYYTAILQHLNYEVRPCASYTEAANLFARENFDLVIVSQGGNKFEGRQVLARAIEADRNTPVLVLTPLPDMACYIEAMQMGAFDYVQKPLCPSEVAEIVKRHVRGTPVRNLPHAEPPRGEWTIGRESSLKGN
jgi:DNA-binding response OmpR family regulator